MLLSTRATRRRQQLSSSSSPMAATLCHIVCVGCHFACRELGGLQRCSRDMKRVRRGKKRMLSQLQNSAALNFEGTCISLRTQTGRDSLILLLNDREPNECETSRPIKSHFFARFAARAKPSPWVAHESAGM